MRSCFEERQAKVNYYVGFAYKVLRMPLKTQQFWLKAQTLNKQSRTLSSYQASQVTKFLQEQQYFTIITEKCESLIKVKIDNEKSDSDLSEKAQSDMIKECLRNSQMMERIDRPNSLLF